MSSSGDARERRESTAPTLSSTTYEEAESRAGDSESFVSAADTGLATVSRSAAASPTVLSSPQFDAETLAEPTARQTSAIAVVPDGMATPHAEEAATIRGASAAAVAQKTAAADMALLTAEASPFSATPVQPAPIGNVATLSTTAPTPVRTRSSGSGGKEGGSSSESDESGEHVAIKFGLDHEQEAALKQLPEDQQEAIRRQIRMDPPRKVSFFEVRRPSRRST